MTPELRISGVEVLILDSGIEYGTMTGDGEVAGPRHTCLVRVNTEAGISGWADVDSNPWVVKAVVEAPAHIPAFCAGLREAVVGQDAWDRHGLWERMYQHSWYHGRRGVALHAISGIDLACWDIAGKASGRPVADLLGGRRHERVRAYASTLFRHTAAEMREACRRYLAQGFRAIKFGWGPWGSDLRRDRELLAAAREEVGPDVDLMVDGYIQGDVKRVRHAVRALEPFELRWVEEPIPADRPRDLATLGCATRLDVASGEQLAGVGEFEELLAEPGVTIVQPDLSRCGGFTALQRITALAERRGVRVVPHAWTSHLLTAAALQANSWLPAPVAVEYNVTSSPVAHSLVREGLKLIDGEVEVPAGPGLGVEVDQSVVERYRVA
jgi:L-rhamnonate dehydratase